MATRKRTPTAPSVPIVRNTQVLVFSDRRSEKEPDTPVIEDPICVVNYNPERTLEIGIGDDELWIKQKGSEFVVNIEGTSYVK